MIIITDEMIEKAVKTMWSDDLPFTPENYPFSDARYLFMKAALIAVAPMIIDQYLGNVVPTTPKSLSAKEVLEKLYGEPVKKT